MSKQEILEQLNTRKEELETQAEEKAKELKWLEEFLKKSNFDDTLEFHTIDLKKLLCAYFHVNCNHIDIPTIEDIANALVPIIQQYPYDSITIIKILTIMAFSRDWDNYIKPALKDKNLAQRVSFLSDRFCFYFQKKTVRDFILGAENAENNIKIVESLRRKLKPYDEELWDKAIFLTCVVRTIVARKETIDCSSSIPQLLKRELAYQEINYIYEVDDIKQELRKIRSYKSNLAQEQRRIPKELRRIDQIGAALANLPDKIVYDYQRYIRGITDAKSYYLILNCIYEHNLPYYEELNNKIQKSEQKPRYQVLLERFGIAIDNELEELAEKYGYETLEGILQRLEDIGFTDQLSEAVKQVTPEYLAEITKLLQQNIIPPQLLVANVSLLNPQSQMVEHVQQNLSSLQILPGFYILHPSALLVEPEVLHHNMMLIKNSDYLESLSVTRDVDFLASRELEECIILALELGLETILEENLDLLNTPVSRLKRLHIAKDLGLPMTTASEIKRILNEEEFIVPDEKLDSYILPRNAVLEPEQLAAMPLEETNRTYCVGGIIIAKMRLGEDVRANPNKESLMKSRQISSREYHQYIKCN